MSFRSRRTFGTSAWLYASLLTLVLIGAAAPAKAQTASFLSSDIATTGNWKGVYGQDGYIIPNDSNVLPSYDSTVTTTGTAYTWYAAGSATADNDPRSLLSGAVGASLTTRIASAYYVPSGSYTIDVNITDGQTHQVTLYLLDEDRQGRTETISIVPYGGTTQLSTVNASGFQGGVYYAWNVSGHVTMTVTDTDSGSSAVVSGIFFGTAAPTTISITNPQPGNISGVIALAANATAAVGVTNVQFQLDGTTVATATGTGPTYTASWNSATASSNGSHTLTAVVTDNLQRTKTSAGVLVTISGAGPPAPEAIFLQTVTTPPASGNIGDWKTLYGQDGFLIPNEPNNSTPAYATITALGSSGLAPTPYAYLDTIPQDITDPRAMQWAVAPPSTLTNGAYTVPNGSYANPPPRNPSVYYDATSMTLDINLTDGNSHQIAIYALDFDSSARAETISILPVVNGVVGSPLSSQSISSFHGGEYLLWTIKGHVRVQITNNNSNDNIVFSGIYFGGGTPAPSVSVTSPASGAVSGTVAVVASATPGNGATIASVQFQLDGVNLGLPQTTAPYSVNWNTTTAISGSHALSAIATDSLGQSTTSAGVTVTVNNPPPAVSIISPTGTAPVLGTISVTATAFSTNDLIASVQFQVDAAPLGTVTTSPYTVQWNTNGVVNGSHTLTAIATDTIGQTNSVSVTVTVSNGGPNVSMTLPTGGAQTGTITVTATTSQTNAPVASVQFQVDGANFGTLQTGSGPMFSISLDTTTLATGSHTLRAIATDNLGQSTTSAAVTITVSNPPPTISMTNPTAGATVVGTITISANAASQTAKVASVQFKLDGTNLGTAVSGSGSTYTASTQWASTTTTNGSHTLTAVVTDSLNQTTTSAGVTVTVSNPPPVIGITSPTGGTVSGSLTVQANATSTIGMASVQFKLDGANLGTAVNGPGPAYSTPWFTGTATNGSHALTAIATDTQGQTTTSATVTVTVTNTPPAINITNPLPSATLLGTVSLTATATSSTSTIASVQFQVDGTNIGSPITTGSGSTFTGSWNTGAVTNGTHSLTAIATDAIGITKTSAAVSVTVNNPAPTITITSPTGAFSLVGTVTVTASAASAIGLASVQFQLDGANLGNAVTGTGPTFTTQWITTATANGSHVLTAIAMDTQHQSTTSSPVTVNVSNGPPPPPSAVFLKTDAKTQGNWPGVYGSDGYIIPNDASNVPGYATLTSTGASTYTWLNPSTPYVQTLLAGPTGTARIASAFYTSTSFSFNVNFNDGQVHQFALYALDYETTTRTETVSILNANTNAVLNSQTLSNFNNGIYALWSLQGHVIIQVTYTGGLNAVASGLFFDTPVPPPAPPTVSVVSPPAGPVSGTVTVSANATSSASIASVQFQVDGKNLGSPVTGAGPIYSYTWNTAAIANGSHLLTAIATDTVNQTTTSSPVSVTTSNVVAPPVISITAPSGGNVIGAVTITANATAVAGMASVQFLLDGSNLGAVQSGSGPTYSIQWNTINATNAPHTISAIGIDNLGQTTSAANVPVTVANVVPTATFIKLDTVTEGNWKGVYGADGYIIPNDSNNPPSYAVVTGPGAAGTPYTWAASTTSASALLQGSSPTNRIASAWYTAVDSTPFSFNINLTDGLTHQLALYCWDFGGGNRTETISILNANTNAVLATQAMSNFTNGTYAVFNISGNVIVTITYTGGLNAVLSGLFLSTVTPPPPPPTVSVTAPAPGSTVLGTITVTASASAGAGMASVQFQVDNKNVGAVVNGVGPTFTGQWNTTAGTNGSHVVTAIATDMLGQTTTSAGVTVTVNNPLAPPVISITAPVAGPVTATVTVTANATAIAGMSSVQFLLDGNNLGAPVSGAGPTYTYQWNTTTTTGGAHVLSAVATDAVSQTTTSATVNVTVNNTGPSATFVKTDAVTQGNWVGTYGGDGYIIPNDATSPPSYSVISGPGAAGPAYTWVASTTDVRALLASPSTSNRIASTWYSASNGTPFVMDINLTDGQTHQLALYLWDLENSGRAENITFVNANTNAVLLNQPMSGFQNGVYAVFSVTGHVQVKFTWTAGLNAVLSGLFLSTPVPPPAPPTVSINSPTSGTSVTGTIALSATASSTVGLASVQFKLDGSNLGSAVTGSGPSFISQWNSTTAANGSHTLTAVATDTTGQTTTSSAISVTTSNVVTPPVISLTAPAAGTVSGVVTVTANATAVAGLTSVQFQLDGASLGAPVTGAGPTYSYQWNTATVTGSHTLTAVATDALGQTTTSASVGVTVSNIGPSATFIKLDTVTQGNWKGAYGADGYLIANDSNVPPSYATITTPSAATGPPYTWIANTTDVRALIEGASQTARIASTWFSAVNGTPFVFDVNLTDGKSHQLALYVLDYENSGRAESISILNAATAAVLVTQPMTSFGGGVYAIFNVTGHVQVKVTYTAGLNAVLSGLFFATPVPPPPPPTISLTAPTTGSQSGTINVTASAAANAPATLASVQFQLDGAKLGAAVTGSSPFTVQWNTTSVTNGSHTLTAIATDSLGQTTTSGSVSVTVNNPLAPPVISITAPAAGPVSGTVTVTANATAVAGMASVQFQLDGVSLGAAVTGTGPTYSYQWNTLGVTGAHTLTAVATDTVNQTTTSAAVSVTVSNVVPSATFVKTDAVTLGNWVGVYGADGYIIPNDANSPPSYAVVTPPSTATGPTYTWAATTTSASALLTSPSSTGRIASTYYTANNSTPFVFDINLTDAQTHQIALYLWDLDNSGRAESITFINASTKAVLATKPMSSFANGVYAVFNVTGHVQAQFSYTAGMNVVLSGLFFSTIVPPPPPPSISLTAPLSGTAQSGTINVTASAVANAPDTMASVQFQLDGANLGSAVTGAGPTFITQWNTANSANGSHTLTAIATDSLGQTTTSGAVAITTANTIAPPVISLTAPAAGVVSGTVSVTANATAVAGMKSVQFLLDGSNLGATVTGAGPTFTYSWNTTAITGAHTLTAVATDNDSQTTTSAPVSVTVSNVTSSATFIKTDAVTQGNWVGVYGGDGYIIPNDANSPPSYVTVAGPGAAGPAYTWAPSSASPSAPLLGPSTTARIASCFFTSTSFSINLNFTDGKAHQLALYLWDLENSNRSETLSILNPGTNAVLATKAMSSFGGGVYAVFDVNGNVTLQVTFNGTGLNAVLSGLFFSTLAPPPAISITAPISGTQTGSVSVTATATANAPATLASVQFQVDGNNLGAALTGSGPAFTTPWNTGNFTNGSHILTAIATDSLGQTTVSSPITLTTANTVTPPAISITAPVGGVVSGTVTVSASATAVAGMKQVQFLLDGSNLGSAVTGAGPTFSYLWNTSALTGGHVLTAVATDDTNQTTTSAPVSVTVSNVGPSATFIKTDAVTQGNWVGVYGADGYIIPNDANAPPSYVTVTGPGAAGPAYTWASSTTSPSALLTGPSSSSRIASTWYTSTSFTINLNLTDGQTHQVALYLWDLENSGRSETLSILNPATNAVLVTKAMSSFGSGMYAVFNISGNVTLQVTFGGTGLNAVLSGLFFSTPVPPPPPPSISLTAPLTGTNQSGTINFTASAVASAPDTMASVQFQVDGVNLGTAVTGAGPTFTTQWNTANFSNGSHTLTAIATDSLGQTTTSSAITVTTTNAIAPPVISITAPAPGVVSGTVSVTANATAVAGMKQVQFLLDGGNLGSAVAGAGPTFTYQWNTSTLTGTHVLSAIATDNDSNTTTSATVSVTISAGPTATFVKTDATTTGNWSGVYGTDGYIIPNDADSPPAYATVILPSSTTGPQYTWAASTTDVEALSTAPFATTRIASTFYSYSDGTPYVFDINLTDGQTHQIALYLWDLDNSGRAETISILNAGTGATLVTKPMSAFQNGVYAVFNVSGHIQVKFTWTAGLNAVVSGLFFSTPAPPPPAPTVSLTAPTSGSNETGTISVTASATANTPATMASVQFEVDGTNIGTAVTGTGPTFTAQWNTAAVSNGSHTLTAVATDSFGQTTTSSPVTVNTTNTVTGPVISITTPAAGPVSGIVTVTASATSPAGIDSVQFVLDGANLGGLQTGTGPSYSVQWNTVGLTGTHTLKAVATDNNMLTTTSAPVSVTIASTASSAYLVKLDTTTLGNWPGVYGADGYMIPDDASLPPAYATVTLGNGPPIPFAWATSTTDGRALYTSPSASSRIASAWYSNTSGFSINVNLTDGQLHQVALYALDFDTTTRNETISILDAASNTVLVTQPMSAFNGGIWAVFNVRGNVIIQVTNNGGEPNIILNGLFFRSFTTVSPPAVSITAPTTGAGVSGPLTLTANATSAQGIVSVQFQIDGVNQGLPQTGAGPNYSIQWASPEVANGVHALTAVATDTLGLSSTSPAVDVTVTNGPPPANSAVFTGSDTTTSGNWVGTYGADGYMMADGGPSPGPDPSLPLVINNPPFYALVNLDGALQWTWHDGYPGTGSFALPISPTSTTLIGAAYYQNFTYPQGGLPLDVDVTFADNLTHQLSLYLVDWHHDIRTQQINIVDPNTQTVLSSQTITNFDQGIYLKYNVQGHVQVQVTLIVTSQNVNNDSIATSVVMAAMFFDPVP